MYGYVRIYKPELKFREYDIYRSCYCGLCHALHKRYGTAARWTLSYDMTFLVLLLTGLYEPVETEAQHRCSAHPFQKQWYRVSEMADYAADMSILLYHEKCMDDWNDERKLSRRAAAGMLKGNFQKAKKYYPEKAAWIAMQLELLHEMEERLEPNAETVAGCFGKLLGELFVWKSDEWEESLRKIGFYLGKFIYLLDAYDDLERDRKKKCYNPFLLDSVEDDAFHENCEKLLQMMISACASEFERLPILKYADILRNILYAGVWQQFYQKKHIRQEKKDESI